MNDQNHHDIGGAWVVAMIVSLLAGCAAPPPAPRVLPPPTTAAAKPDAAVKDLSSIVYDADFTQEPGKEWSQTDIGTTPRGDVPFLGPIAEEPLLFTTGKLPPHQFIRVTFKLLTYQPWNGDSAYNGRDLWDMRVVNGQPLIHTTFSDCGYFSANNEQSFPDQYPWYPTHPGWAGADNWQTLGYSFAYPNGNGVLFRDTDSTYAFDLTFPHSRDTLQLQFKSLSKAHQFKPYCFLSFKVQTVDHAAAADEKTLAGWWSDLGDDDPVNAYNAVWAMIATGDTATKYINANLPSMDPDNSFPINIDQTQLWKPGSFNLASPDARRLSRAIHVLEVINSSDSLALLKEIGYQGTPEGAPPDQWMESTPQALKDAQDLQSDDVFRVHDAIKDLRDQILDQQSNFCIDLLLKAKKFEEVDSICLESMLAHPEMPFWVSNCQQARTRALMGLGKNEEALAAAKGYYNISPLPETDGAINLLAVCLERARPDGKELAARFRRQQAAWADPKYSPAAAPAPDADLGDPILPTIKIDAKPFQDALNAITPDQNNAGLAKGNLLLLSDQAADARAAFEQADTSQDAADNIARALRAQNGCLGPAIAHLSAGNTDAPN